mmetsp:Transcript_28021/g.83068  ORF Transcript_28021/g.83068 Transcript_28021/m.83068 type:complete len:121 (+) Transcript_28021:59-421(+)
MSLPEKHLAEVVAEAAVVHIVWHHNRRYTWGSTPAPPRQPAPAPASAAVYGGGTARVRAICIVLLPWLLPMCLLLSLLLRLPLLWLLLMYFLQLLPRRKKLLLLLLRVIWLQHASLLVAV